MSEEIFTEMTPTARAATDQIVEVISRVPARREFRCQARVSQNRGSRVNVTSYHCIGRRIEVAVTPHGHAYLSRDLGNGTVEALPLSQDRVDGASQIAAAMAWLLS